VGISLLISDVDGTLVTKDKALTQRAIAAVHALKSKGIKFALTSARPPAGMASFVAPLALDTPLAGFNGGMFVNPANHVVMAQHLIDPNSARRSLEIIRGYGLDPWVFVGSTWLITDRTAPLIALERRTIAVSPTVVREFGAALDQAAKIVGASEDYALVEQCETELRNVLGGLANAVRSQPYYLDVTDTHAHKGAVVAFLSKYLSIPAQDIATIGDMVNDVRMFHVSGMSIAMGNATEDVKREANRVTDSCDDEGFAKAVERFILGGDRPSSELKHTLDAGPYREFRHPL
jgi:Cof subfamily protein (haloacid dehalogenase superfamily)